MYYRVIANVDRHMSTVTDHISRKLVRIAYCLSAVTDSAGRTGSRDPELLMDLLYKPGAVNTIGQAVSAVYIFISYVFASLIGDLLSQRSIAWLGTR